MADSEKKVVSFSLPRETSSPFPSSGADVASPQSNVALGGAFGHYLE
jgi:hypothetical protein